MTTLMSLSNEVIDIILSYGDISFEDIINLRCVCKKFRNAAKTEENYFLKKKFSQRWPSAKKYYNELQEEKKQKESKKNEQKDKNCDSFIKTGIYCAKHLRNYILQMMFISKCHNLKMSFEPCLSKDLEEKLHENLKEIRKFKTENYTQILFFMDEMEHLLTQPLRAGYDLTERCCYLDLFDYLRIYWRKHILKKYIKNKSHHKQLLEESATILAQQLQLGKDVSYSSVKASLNTIVQGALNFLKKKHPSHSIFTTPDECFSDWENGNIDDNFWSKAEGTQIMDTLEEYMFGKLNFRSINSRDLEYTCIDYVLKNKCGLDIIIFIIYHSVARRLGLRCDVVYGFYFSCLIKHEIKLLWVPKYTFAAKVKRNISDLIDVNSMRCYSRIKFGKFPNCIIKNNLGEMYEKTFAKMLKSILIRESELYLFDFINGDIEIICEEFLNGYPKARTHKMKFAVGMIVKHGDESTDCPTGVIIGWYQHNFNDIFHCENIDNIAEYVMPLNICGNFNATGKQIYYIILTKRNKLCFVEEGAVTLTEPKWIENRNIYRFFSEFKGTHYVPNEMLASVYSDDAAITAKTIFKN